MTIGIYNPYLDTLGGGERYCFDIASCLLPYGDVHIFWDDPEILPRARERFGISMKGIQLVKNIWKTGSVFRRINETRKYDAIFFVSDGSIPFLFSKKAFLLLQFPVSWVGGKDLLTKLKARRITSLLCYSEFVKHHLDLTFGMPVQVLAPPVDRDSFTPGKKERLILSVGRFTTGMNTKKQDVLVRIFKKLYDNGLRDWKLILTGGLLPHDEPFLRGLNKQAHGYPIDIRPDISFGQLKELYGRARVYWHAAGFGEDLARHPERAEHFGLTTIEAMAGGAVPVVFAGGGQKEVVQDGENGFLWQTPEDLMRITTSVTGDTKTWSRVSRGAQRRAKDFSRERFCTQLTGLL